MKTQLLTILVFTGLCIGICGDQFAAAQTLSPQLTSARSLITKQPTTFGSVKETANDDLIDIEFCGVQLIEDVDVPALESGQLVLVNSRVGQLIKLGEILAQINDQMPRRALEEATFKHQIANEKANDVTDIESAEKKLALATKELERNASLRPNGSVSEFEYQRTRYTKDIAQLEFAAANRDKRLAAVEAQSEMVKVNAANDSIARHLLTSPFDGNVLEVHKHPGEWVNAGETVLRIARMDKLRVIGNVDAFSHDPHEMDGKRVTVSVELARKRIVELTGKIVYASLERNLGAGTTYAVWAEVDNQMENGHWLLQPDAKVTLRIFLK